jgi:hypothetical protein
MLDLKFDEGQMRAIVTKAILEGIETQQRDLIIQKALEHLLSPANPNSYNDKRSKLEEAFETAVRGAMAKIATEELAKPENTERIRTLFAGVVEKAFSEEGQVFMRDKMVEALAGAMRKERY